VIGLLRESYTVNCGVDVVFNNKWWRIEQKHICTLILLSIWHCLCIGCLVLFFAASYPLRSVSALTLLKGGKELGVTTYSYFGRTRYFSVPLEDVSCTRSRLSSPNHAAMKIRGHWMYFLLDNRDGKFHQPQLFDYVIGLNRSFKWKKV